MQVSFGRYIPLNSVIHKMDPRFKLAMIFLLIVALFVPYIGYTGYILLTASVLIIYGLSKLSWRMLAKVFIPVSIIFAVILIINIFMMKMDSNLMNELVALTNGGTYKFDNTDKKGVRTVIEYSLPNGEIWPSGTITGGKFGVWGNAKSGYEGYLPWTQNKIFVTAETKVTDKEGNVLSSTKESIQVLFLGHFFRWKALWFSERALYSAFLMSWRIFLMITLTTILTGTTQPMEITLGLEDLLTPLKWIGIPVHILATIISIALRMIPDLMNEAGRIMKAQASRGIDMKNGKGMDKLKGVVSLIIPLLVSSFQKAEDMAYAMDARDYDPHAKRTRFHQFTFSWTDFAIFIVFSIVACLIFAYSGVSAPESSTSVWVLQNMHIKYLDGVTLY